MYNIITSYPKSGNTWLRFIIYELYFGDDNSDINSKNIEEFIPGINKQSFQKVIDNKHNYKNIFFKSHYSYVQMKKLKLGKIILIVRNPLEVLSSLIDYYQIPVTQIDESVDQFSRFHTLINMKKQFKYPSWSEHLNGWKNSDEDLLILTYNDLIDNFNINIIKIINFLNIDFDQKKIDLIKDKTSFNSLKKLENYEKKNKIDGFFKIHEKINFINKGKKKSYFEKFSNSQIKKLEKSFLKYINEYKLMN